MYRLTYVSTARSDIAMDDITRILDASASNNYERYITGFLVHHGSYFMQCIEGPHDEVIQLFARIKTDPRHSGVIQISGEQVKERAFPDWSMNYFRVDDPNGRAMVVKSDDPAIDLLPKLMQRDLLHLFTRFMNMDPA